MKSVPPASAGGIKRVVNFLSFALNPSADADGTDSVTDGADSVVFQLSNAKSQISNLKCQIVFLRTR